MSFYTEEQLHKDTAELANNYYKVCNRDDAFKNWIDAEDGCLDQAAKSKYLSEDFIEKYKDKFCWNDICLRQKLSEDFIERHIDRVDKYYICFQKLSEDFIERHIDKLDLKYIVVYQKLSEEFLEKHIRFYSAFQAEISRRILLYQKLSNEFRQKYSLLIPEDNWLYASKEDKLKYIKENTNYEIINDEYVLAYKSTRHDGYSVACFRYKYEVGKTYEAHCDCNLLEENSFGLSAWTKDDALSYYSSGELYLVKICIEDIGAITSRNKIRCFKLTVLEKIEDV